MSFVNMVRKEEEEESGVFFYIKIIISYIEASRFYDFDFSFERISN